MAEKKKTKKRKLIKRNACNTEIKPITKKIKEKENNQIKWVLIITVLIFVAFLGTYWYGINLNRFEFAGVKWDKINYKGITLYYSKILGENFDLYLRNDPRENNISADIEFKLYPDIIISLEPEAGDCFGANMAQLELAKFLGDIFAGDNPKIEGAISDESKAKEENMTFANCSHAINQTVILVQKSEIPEITREGNCYIIDVGECENVKAAERFIIGIIAQINEKNE